MYLRVLVGLMALVLSGCGGTAAPLNNPSAVPITLAQPLPIKSFDVVTAFEKAGLAVGEFRPMTTEDYRLTKDKLTGTVDGTRFFIPSLCADECGGRVFIFDNLADYETQKNYYVRLALFSWVFVNSDNLLVVQINGDLDETTALKYQDALASLGEVPVELAYAKPIPKPTNTPAPTKTSKPTRTPTPTKLPAPSAILSETASLYDGPDLKFSILATLDAQEKVFLRSRRLEADVMWFEVNFSGRVGWVLGSVLNIEQDIASVIPINTEAFSTPTPRPTATEVPTATPPPEPITIEGTGQTVTDSVFIPFPLARVLFAHDGTSNFIVTAYQGDDDTILTNEIGRYTGTRLVSGEKETIFEVNADGGWFIMIQPLVFSPSIATDGTNGVTDDISGLFTPTKLGPVAYHFTHEGEQNFIVQLICGGGTDYVQNEIGAVDGDAIVRFKDGPCLWDVQADGNWTIAPK